MEAELKVLHLLQEKNYEILHHRLRTPFAEVDILVRGKREQLVMIEVKHRRGSLNDQPVVSHFQKKRLVRAMLWLTEQGFEVELWLAVVGQKQGITFIQDVFR